MSVLFLCQLFIGTNSCHLAHENFNWQYAINIIALTGLLMIALCLFLVNHSIEKKRTSLLTGLFEVASNKYNWLLAMYTFFNYAPMIIFAGQWSTLFISTIKHTGKAAASTYGLVMWLALGVVAPLLGQLIKKRFSYLFVLTACSIIGFLSSFVIIYLDNISSEMLYLCCFLFGGASAAQILVFAVAKLSNSAKLGTVIGL